MGMGAGFGVMMPGMIQQAMSGAAQAASAPPPVPTPAPASAAVAAGPSRTAAVGDFADLAPLVKDPRALVRGVAQSAGFAVVESGDAWQVTVPVGPLRKQVVTVQFGGKDDEGHGVIAYSSTCGPSTEQNAMALLKYNTKLVHGAFAVVSSPSGDMVVLQANQLADSADPLAVTRVLTALAWQADKVEEKLSGGDQY
jgi:hypothetical protein